MPLPAIPSTSHDAKPPSHDFIARLYESVTDPVLLNSVLHEIAERTQCRAANLVFLDHELNVFDFDARAGVDGSSLEELATISNDYAENFFQIDYRRMHADKLPLGEWFQCHTVFVEHKLKRNRFFNDFVRKWDYRYLSVARLGTAGAVTGYLALNRRAARGPHSAAQIRFLQKLTPHLMAACRIFFKTRRLRPGFVAGLDLLQYLSSAIFLLDKAGRLLFANIAGNSLLQHCDQITVINGILTVTADPLRKQLGHELKRAQTTGLPGAVILDATADASSLRNGSSGLPVYVISLPRHSDFFELNGDPSVAILVPPTESTPTGARLLLRTLYRLSPREIEVALSIATGTTLQAYAAEKGIEVSTARSQLKAVFARTGTHRQLELVRLISSLPRIDVSIQGATNLKALQQEGH